MTDFHDRFLIIDNIELHGLGSSINCLGRRVTSYSTRGAKEIAKLLEMLPERYGVTDCAKPYCVRMCAK